MSHRNQLPAWLVFGVPVMALLVAMLFRKHVAKGDQPCAQGYQRGSLSQETAFPPAWFCAVKGKLGGSQPAPPKIVRSSLAHTHALWIHTSSLAEVSCPLPVLPGCPESAGLLALGPHPWGFRS